MALYSSKTTAEKAVVEPFTNNFRAWAGSLGRLMIEARVLKAAYEMTGGTQDILADVTDSVPNTGGLNGAIALPIADYNALTAGLNAFLTTYDTQATRERIAQAAGATAGL